MSKVVSGFETREVQGGVLEILGYSNGKVTEVWEVVTKVKVLKDSRSGEVIGYMTDGGKSFRELGDAITAQLIWKSTHPDIKQMIVGWVTYKDHPFIRFDYPAKFMFSRSTTTEKGKVNYQILPSPKSYMVSNDTPFMLIIIDKTNSMVTLVPSGERIEF